MSESRGWDAVLSEKGQWELDGRRNQCGKRDRVQR